MWAYEELHEALMDRLVKNWHRVREATVGFGGFELALVEKVCAAVAMALTDQEYDAGHRPFYLPVMRELVRRLPLRKQ